jgi:3-deoxy-D-manno-octulosonate 8-phosphate phosphatase (KDO 8-P phosphatase)
VTPELSARLARVRLLSLDVDGVMTDGGLYYAADGSELRRFNVRDGVAIKALMAAGVAVAFVTTSTTPAIRHRAEMLGVPHCFTGATDKVAAVSGLAKDLGLTLADVAHMADDTADLAILTRVGLAIAVADAAPEVLRAAAYVTRRRGGDAAVREAGEAILAAKSKCA